MISNKYDEGGHSSPLTVGGPWAGVAPPKGARRCSDAAIAWRWPTSSRPAPHPPPHAALKSLCKIRLWKLNKTTHRIESSRSPQCNNLRRYHCPNIANVLLWEISQGGRTYHIKNGLFWNPKMLFKMSHLTMSAPQWEFQWEDFNFKLDNWAASPIHFVTLFALQYDYNMYPNWLEERKQPLPFEQMEGMILLIIQFYL